MLRMLRQYRTLPPHLALILASTADTIMAAIVMLVPQDMLMEQAVALLRKKLLQFWQLGAGWLSFL